MAQFLLRHPDGQQHARYGWDHAVSYFVEVRRGGRIVATYDALAEAFDAARPLEGALRFLIESGFFTQEELEEAIGLGAALLLEEMEEPLRRVAEVVGNLKLAAD
jgi:hypothetical protein